MFGLFSDKTPEEVKEAMDAIDRDNSRVHGGPITAAYVGLFHELNNALLEDQLRDEQLQKQIDDLKASIGNALVPERELPEVSWDSIENVAETVQELLRYRMAIINFVKTQLESLGEEDERQLTFITSNSEEIEKLWESQKDLKSNLGSLDCQLEDASDTAKGNEKRIEALEKQLDALADQVNALKVGQLVDLPNHIDNQAATENGVKVGELYRSGNIVKVRTV